MIRAEVICDSISVLGDRLTTFKLRYPKFIHGEFMTHRVISRNASSSRAIPTKKLIEEVRSDALRAAPVFWGKNQPGMQAAEELDYFDFWKKGQVLSPREKAKDEWRSAAIAAAEYAQRLDSLGVHKQIVNRILEPFSHINVVATATEWDNFFGLRLHKDAQPEMRVLANAMWQARKQSTPVGLRPGAWHLPFCPDVHGKRCTPPNDDAIKVSVARCARVSYESHETGRPSTIDEDLKLYDRLLGAQPLHASPAEHQATPDVYRMNNVHDFWFWEHLKEHGNFVGWRQYRKMLPGEDVAPLPDEYVRA